MLKQAQEQGHTHYMGLGAAASLCLFIDPSMQRTCSLTDHCVLRPLYVDSITIKDKEFSFPFVFLDFLQLLFFLLDILLGLCNVYNVGFNNETLI